MAPAFKVNHKPSAKKPPRDYAADEACAVAALRALRLSGGGFCIPELPSPSPQPAGNPTPATAQKGDDRVYNCNKCTAWFKLPQALGGHMTCHRSKPTEAAAGTRGGGSAAADESGRVLPSESLPESSSMTEDDGVGPPSRRRDLDIDLNRLPFDD